MSKLYHLVGIITLLSLTFNAQGSQGSCANSFGYRPFPTSIGSVLSINNGVTLEHRSRHSLFLYSDKYAIDRHFQLEGYGPLQGMNLSPQGERMVLFFSREIVVYDIVEDKTVFYQEIPEALHHPFRPHNAFILWNDDHQFVVERVGVKSFLLAFWEDPTITNLDHEEFNLGRYEPGSSHRHWSTATLWARPLFLEKLLGYYFLKERGLYLIVQRLFRDSLPVQVAAPDGSRNLMTRSRLR